MEKVILETKDWLANVGLEISTEKTKLRKASESFTFLGFQIILVSKQGQYSVKITPSKENVKRLINKTRNIIQNNKSASSYALIDLLRPVLVGWGNYFRYIECKKTFNKIDKVIYNQIRAWVFRRATRQGRETVKQKYFPEDRVYKFQNRTYKANWVLNGTRTLKEGKPSTAHLPKMAWIAREKYVKVKETNSVFDGNHIYWAERCPRYSS
jgi:RNA-directed DNA polymerase